MPAFACGIFATCGLQVLTRLVSGSSGGSPELSHMAKAMHAEVELVQRLLAECRQEKGSAAIPTTSAAPSEVPVPPRAATVVNLMHHDETGRRLGIGPPNPVGALLDGAAKELGTGSVLYVASIVLFLLDMGLLCFCLSSLLTPAAKGSLESTLVATLRYVGLQPRFETMPTPPDAGSPMPSSGTPRGALGLVDPSGGAMLVRRREQGPSSQQRHAELLQESHGCWTAAAIGSASFLGVVATRCLMCLFQQAGWRFFLHLLGYAVITLRVCLGVLLLLF